MNTVFMSLVLGTAAGSAFDCFMALGGWHAVFRLFVIISISVVCMLTYKSKRESIRKHQIKINLAPNFNKNYTTMENGIYAKFNTAKGSVLVKLEHEHQELLVTS
jgi:predicted MFS family arabinose efflux permease